MLVLGSVSAPNDRSLPCDIHAEQAALGSVLIKPAAVYDLATGLNVDDFFLPAHREIFDGMLAIEKRRVPLDIIAVADELKSRGVLGRLEGGEAYLNDIANATPTADNVSSYVRIVKQKSSLRKLIAACYETVSQAFGSPSDVSAVFGEASAKIAAAEMGTGRGLRKFSDIAPGLLDTLEERMNKFRETGSLVTGVPFGVKELDELTSGMQPGDLVVIAAATSVGKTALAMQSLDLLVMSDPSASGIAINLEMMDTQLAERLVASDAQVNSYLLKTGQIAEHFKDITASVGRLAGTRLYIEDKVKRIDHIRSTLIRWRNESVVRGADGKESRGLGIVDFAQMIRATESMDADTRSQQIGQIGQELKDLAKQLRIPIILISQVNRVGVKGKERPTLHDLKESGDLENAADIIVIIENKADKPGGDSDPVMFHVDKNRSGQRRSAHGRYIGRHYRFVDDDEAS